MRTLARGNYVWVYGDADALHDGALAGIVGVLKREAPGLIVAIYVGYRLPMAALRVYSDYRAYAKTCIQVNAHVLGEQSLITSNIHRRDCYDVEYARKP